MTHDAFDKCILARVCVPQGDQKSCGTVTARKRDADGRLIGNSNANPFLDTAMHEVKFDSGETEAHTANIIAESICAQVDDDGCTTMELDEIIDHRSDGDAVTHADAYVTHNGKQKLCRTTKGWFLCCQFKDGSTEWRRLVDLKEAYPIQTAECAVANKIDHEPAFKWWVHCMLKKGIGSLMQ